jgi:nucleotide-binding universal stress UspA family protein
MNKILVPTDLSSAAELGLQLASEIARKCGATVCLVNFTRHPYGTTFSGTGEVRNDSEEDLFTMELLKARKAQMEELVARYSSSEFKMEIAIVDDKFKNGVDEYLQKENIDLIVMGTSGEESGIETLSGNHAEQAIRVSTCPVLSVRDGFKAEQFRTMVVAVTVISDNRMADGLARLKELADCFDSQVHLVHVRDNKSDPTLILHEYFTKMATIAGIKDFKVRILEGDDVTDALSQYAQEVGAGLIAVVKNKREGIFRIFSNNRLSHRLLKEESGPVVTVKLPEL